MASRIVNRLVWAKECQRPNCIPEPRRVRGAKGKGLAYERELAKALPAGKHGQWFEFQDAHGHGWCQTDLLLDLGYAMLVLEAKYTWVAEGHGQAEWLYRPVVEWTYGKPCLTVVVCKVLTSTIPKTVKVAGTLADAVQWAKRGATVLHWIGGTPGPLAIPHGAAHIAPADIDL